MGRVVRRALAALCAALTLLSFAACGSEEARRLDRPRTDNLRDARDRIGSALATERLLSGSGKEARALVRDVRRISSRRDIQSEALDEFGLASLGELKLLVPSLVMTDPTGVETSLDRDSTMEFLRYAESDPPRALLRPATLQVQRIVEQLRRTKPSLDEKVSQPRPTAPRQPTVREYLTELERDVDPVWPDLADRLASLRAELA